MAEERVQRRLATSAITDPVGSFVPRNPASTTTRRLAALSTATCALALLGVLGNKFGVPLFFGVDFIFGSIAALIAISLLGAIPGMLVAAAAAAYTFFLWGHPYSVFVFLAEAAVVAFLRRKSLHIALADALYWVLIGIPLVTVLFPPLLGLPYPVSGMIALKQAVNGVFNAAAAAFIVIGVRFIWQGRERTSFSGALFNILLGAILVPGLILITMGRSESLDPPQAHHS